MYPDQLYILPYDPLRDPGVLDDIGIHPSLGRQLTYQKLHFKVATQRIFLEK